MKRFRSSVSIAKTRMFPGADFGSDYELVMMTFNVHLKRVNKFGHDMIKFDIEKLKDPEVAEAFHPMIGRTFAALTNLDNTASEILDKHHPVKKHWITGNLLDMCDKQRVLKKKKDAEGVILRQHRAVNQEINKGMTRQRLTGLKSSARHEEK